MDFLVFWHPLMCFAPWRWALSVRVQLLDRWDLPEAWHVPNLYFPLAQKHASRYDDHVHLLRGGDALPALVVGDKALNGN
jgi:hypothetical protein